MEVRSRPALAVALSLIAASGVLGVLVHDAEIGATAATLSPGDDVRIKGEAHPLAGDAPVAVLGPAFWLVSDQWDGAILVTEPPRAPENGVWVISGSVRAIEPWHAGRLLIVQAAAVTAPLVFD